MLRLLLAAACLLLGSAKVLQIDGPLYFWIGVGECLIGGMLLLERTTELALHVLMGGLTGAGLAQLWALYGVGNDHWEVCRCLGFVESPRHLVVLLHGALLVTCWLSIGARKVRPESRMEGA